MKKVWLLILGMALCSCAATAKAQHVGGGSGDGPCDSSPENPTAVLAVIGSSGAALAALRVRWNARKRK